MSVRSTIQGFYGGDAPMSLRHLLDRYRDEVREDALRGAAEKLRDASPFGRGPCVLGRAADYRCGSEYCESCTVKSLIDLIDPDKENSADGTEADRA